MKFAIPKGCNDILPTEVGAWQAIEELIRALCHTYAYMEIRTPTFEHTELFLRSSGETSDIVSKEMYTFEDKGHRSLTLRPEGTAPVIRSYVENGLHHSPYQKFFYIGPYFRYDRPQAGRCREFHQFGIEHIGRDDPEADFEAIDLLFSFYQRLGLSHLTLLLNSVGDEKTRTHYKELLKNYLKPHFDALSSESQSRFEKNPLRILDTKNKEERLLLKEAPSILDCLSDESLLHFEQLQKLLTKRNIPFTIDPSLVRGLDYYNRTVFEITSTSLGAQNTLGAGGRYNGLIAACGGPDLPAVGFGTGLERILLTLKAQNLLPKTTKGLSLFIIPLGDAAQEASFNLLFALRKLHLAAEIYARGKKLQKGLQLADELEAEFVIVLGETELASGEIDLKHMKTRTQEKVRLDPCTIAEHIRAKI
ncbi:MAG: histidine--tRNA ligase [Simkaniaceae bacterium]|nr:histidine--tRNA ligase [Simkaniaceae bacterium]